MIARDNYTRELGNRAARAQLKHEGALPARGIFLGGREYAPGDRVIARRNHRQHDIDNGTLATVLHIDPATGTMRVRPDIGRPRTLDPDYVAQHLQHAYALTAHSAQGATFQWVGVTGRPKEFTREWAYTALSCARHHTTIHLINEPPERERQREEYAPADAARDIAQARQALRLAMKRQEAEALATARIRRHSPDGQPGGPPSPDPLAPAASRLKALDRLRRGVQQRNVPSLRL
jgi:ATP-dependent exoDNAse (exonuclease V) alpha subunit